VAAGQHEMPTPSNIAASPANTIFRDVGLCDLPVTTNNELAARLTKQGFALIHCFWYNEAVRSFRDAIREDPQLAIAYAGLAHALNQPRYTRAQYKAEASWASMRSVTLVKNGSETEQAVIAALRGGHESGRDTQAWANTMGGLIRTYPDLMEARVLLAGMLFQLRYGSNSDPKDGDEPTGRNRVIELCEEVIKKSPEHAAALHYHIHVCESREPARALESARKLTRLAVDSPHMVHMPGHIFYRVGDYEAAHAAFYEADRKSKEYARKLGKNPGEVIWDYGHNRMFWAAALVEGARFKDLRLNMPGPMAETLIHHRSGNWNQLNELAKSNRLSNNYGPLPDYVNGWLSIQAENWEAFDTALGKLKVEIKGTDMYSRIPKSFVEELEGVRMIRQRKFEEGFEKLREAVKTATGIPYQEPPLLCRLPHETLAALLIERGETAEAMAVLESGLKDRPNSPFLLSLMGEAFLEAGDRVKAKEFFDKVMTTGADRDSLPVVRASQGLAKLKGMASR